MAPTIKRLAILFLGLWLVTVGLTEQLAEAAAGRTSPGYSKPTSSPSGNVWGSRSGGGSYGYSKPAAPAPGGYSKPATRQTAPGGYTKPTTGQTGPRATTYTKPDGKPPATAGGIPNRGKARLRQLIPPRPPGPRTPKPARPSAPSLTRSLSKGCKGRELPSP